MGLHRRPLLGVLAAAALAAALPSLAAAPAVGTHRVLGPSGRPAVPLRYPANRLPAETDAPMRASADAVVADRDSVSDQLAYARAAAALPVAERGRRWTSVGPYGIVDPPGSPQGALRQARDAGMGVTLAVDPRDRSGNTVYGGTIGGLLKSTDGGAHWRQLADGFTRAGVGAVGVDPARPDDVYAGTGVGLLTISGDTPGVGVYVSHDGGRHFTRPVRNVKGYGVNAIAVTRDGVLVGTTHGLYRSTDRGRSFSAVPLPTNAAHTAPATGAYANWVSAIVVNPGDARDVTVAIGLGLGHRAGPDGRPLSTGNGLYRSSRGARGPFTWFSAGTAALAAGNPAASTDPLGRIALAYGAVHDERHVLWALVSDAGLENGQQPGGLDLVGTTTGQTLNRTSSVLNGLFRSDDDGATWTLKATSAELQAAVNEALLANAGLGYGVGVQGFYNLWVQGNPKDDSKVYLGLEEVFQSTANAGATPGRASFEVIQRYWDACGSTTELDNVTKGVSCPDQTPYYGGTSTHPDQHAGLAVPTSSGVRLYTANDGGFFRQDAHPLPSGDTNFDNKAWTDLNGVATTEAWQVARKPDGEFLAANQDNGAGFFAPGRAEQLVSSGDGVQTAATSNPDTWYSSAQGLVLYVTTNHGQDVTNIQPGNTGAAFLSPFRVDPLDENHLVSAARDIRESTKGPGTTVLFDPVLGTIVSSDWSASFDAGTSPYKRASGKAIDWSAQALAVRGPAIYAGLCAVCRNSLGDPKLINDTIATNVRPGCTAKVASGDCWHLARGRGLPHVGINAVAIDPRDTRTVYAVFTENSLVGLDKRITGTPRVMVSHDAGDTFRDITGNLPGNNVRDVVVRDGRLVVGSDQGIFTASTSGGRWSRLGVGLPAVRVFSLSLDRTGRYLTASLYGRGVWVLDLGRRARSSSAGPDLGARPVAAPRAGRPGAPAGPSPVPGVLGLLLVLGPLGAAARAAVRPEAAAAAA